MGGLDDAGCGGGSSSRSRENLLVTRLIIGLSAVGLLFPGLTGGGGGGGLLPRPRRGMKDFSWTIMVIGNVTALPRAMDMISDSSCFWTGRKRSSHSAMTTSPSGSVKLCSWVYS